MLKSYFVHPTSVIDKPVKIGKGTKIWHFCHVMQNSEIGEDCTLGQNVFIQDGVKIGKGCKIQNNVSIYKGVELKDDVFCGPSMVFTNVMKPRSAFPQEDKNYVETLVKKGVSIGANATIVCGITVGKWAFIGAGSVVTRDVPDYSLVYGVPAKIKGWICECGTKLEFGDVKAKCEKCGREYEKKDETVKKLNRTKDLEFSASSFSGGMHQPTAEE